jgi:hypothetical protein
MSEVSVVWNVTEAGLEIEVVVPEGLFPPCWGDW